MQEQDEQDSKNISLIAFRRLAEGVFEYIGFYQEFIAGEIKVASIGPEREIFLAVIAVELVDNTSNMAKIEPLFFNRYILNEASRFNIGDCFNRSSAERSWEPTKLDYIGLHASMTHKLTTQPAYC